MGITLQQSDQEKKCGSPYFSCLFHKSIKFQGPTFSGSWRYPKVTHRQTDAQAKTNIPPQLLWIILVKVLSTSSDIIRLLTQLKVKCFQTTLMADVLTYLVTHMLSFNSKWLISTVQHRKCCSSATVWWVLLPYCDHIMHLCTWVSRHKDTVIYSKSPFASNCSLKKQISGKQNPYKIC